MSTTQCQEVTRKSASNLALAFILLPREKRAAMAALYAFCREVDDVADEDIRDWVADSIIPVAEEGGYPEWIQRVLTTGDSSRRAGQRVDEVRRRAEGR